MRRVDWITWNASHTVSRSNCEQFKSKYSQHWHRLMSWIERDECIGIYCVCVWSETQNEEEEEEKCQLVYLSAYRCTFHVSVLKKTCALVLKIKQCIRKQNKKSVSARREERERETKHMEVMSVFNVQGTVRCICLQMKCKCNSNSNSSGKKEREKKKKKRIK